MKHFLKATFAVGLLAAACSTQAQAQTYNVELNGLGSSALYLALGEAGSQPSAFTIGTTVVSPTCLWTEGSNTVIATDTSTGTAFTDAGSAWVSWTKSTAGSCATYTASDTVYIFAYEQTDSVVGNRCYFNSYNLSKCSVAYPAAGGASGFQIYPSTGTCGTTTGSTPGECPLPAAVATHLNSAKLNYAGTDIRPEDAEFAQVRAVTACGVPVSGSSQYLGLGYTNGTDIHSDFSTAGFHVINFSLPSSYSVTIVGAAPIIFAVNGSAWPFSTSSHITSANLAHYLDGTNSWTGQLYNANDLTGTAVTQVLREPLSGTANTTEYNVPNTTVTQTSQYVGKTQPADQQACTGNIHFFSGSTANPLHIKTHDNNGGLRRGAIGNGQELSSVISVGNVSTTPAIGYGFWSVPNFKGFTSTGAPNAHYLNVDGIDPLSKSTVAYTGVIPTTAAQIANVDLHNVANGTYPVWSYLRLINGGATVNPQITQLATEAQKFVPAGIAPNFVKIANMTVVRSHFTPPAGSGYPANANGDSSVGSGRTACTAKEAGGDVGGVVLTLTADSSYCTAHGVTTGQTGLRR